MTIYIPVPTCGNQWNIFREAGLPTQPYHYYNAATNQLDFSGLLEVVQQAPPGSIIFYTLVLTIPRAVIQHMIIGRKLPISWPNDSTLPSLTRLTKASPLATPNATPGRCAISD
jgi:Aminotransferase class I and II